MRTNGRANRRLLVKARIFTRLEAQPGWIIRAEIEGSELFAKQPQLVDRCHAFEAGLFMMGYDLRSLVPDGYMIPVPPNPNYRVRRMTRAT
ncbi:hypothetical protein BKM07_03040 [Pseudomonas syringae group genomosp. 3]|uniref:Uncharacterized protein n=1 Tax=Pseudomonas syringae group genomosp. 3 TaxID=251701 RepID=A0ABD6VIM5_9PSED|nr:hypothetical protein BKM07_03040 [Pseudomonas syringae group genomosp. 3]